MRSKIQHSHNHVARPFINLKGMPEWLIETVGPVMTLALGVSLAVLAGTMFGMAYDHFTHH